MWNQKERARKNHDTNLHGSTMCLRPQECGYISVYHLGLHHNIFIRKPKLRYLKLSRNPKNLRICTH
jgi:hypothetical protein